MDAIAAALEKIRSFTWASPPVAPIEKYLATGAAEDLDRIQPPGRGSFWVSELSEAIARPDRWGVRDQRALHVLVRQRSHDDIGHWLETQLRTERPEEDLFAPVAAELRSLGLSEVDVLSLALGQLETLVCSADGRPGSLGRRLLQAPDRELEAALRGRGARARTGLWPEMASFVKLLDAHAPERLNRLASAILIKTSRSLAPEALKLLVARGDATVEQQVLRFLREAPDGWERFHLGCALHAANPARYGQYAWDAALEALAMGAGSANQGPVAKWMVGAFGDRAIPPLVAFVKGSEAPHWTRQAVESVAPLGTAGVPVLQVGLSHREPGTRLAALAQLVALADDRYDAAIEPALRQGLSDEEPSTVVQSLSIAGRWKPAAIADAVWSLLEHRSKPVREAAGRALGRAGDSVVERARTLLASRKADVRSAAALVLEVAGTAGAMEALEQRSNEETNDDVRDQILKAIEAVSQRSGRQLDRTAIATRVQRAAARLGKPVVEWLDEARLPALSWHDGGAVDATTVRWLLHRQSRARGIAADVEARPLFALIDRRSSGPFARFVLDAFLQTGARSEDRWAMALAALLGDDGLVPVLGARIREWVDAQRGKLAEYGVQALALIGTDAALLAVDGMAIRYRTKMKNVGRAASEAFTAAAAARGLSPEELGDRVVPWLGFEPGRPRIVDTGKLRVELGVGLDLKLSFRDAASGKRLASLPKGAPPEAAAEIKELAATLKEVAKGQLLRIENLFTMQRRWPPDRWRELFLGHPLLRPFAVRLLWGNWDESGRLTRTFRALADLSLTTAADEPVDPPGTGLVGMVHPLELEPELQQQWQVHLADHEIDPPFPQLARPIVRTAPESSGRRFWRAGEGTKLNAMTFKGRAERLGWHRGSVCDGGSITAYVKSFPAGGVDVVLAIEGLFVGAGIDDQVTLGAAYFVKAGSVRFGSYDYDEPSSEEDPRVVPLGQVPAIPFSEAMAELQGIAGTVAG